MKAGGKREPIWSVVCGSLCAAVLAVLLGYFFLTPRGSVSLKLLVFNPFYAFTYEVAETSTNRDGNLVYMLADPIIGNQAAQNRLDRWTVQRLGPLCWATYSYA